MWKLTGCGRVAAMLAIALAVVSAQTKRPTAAARKAHDTFQQGLRAEQAGRVGDARASYEKAIAIDAACAEAWHALGKLQESAGDLDGARKSFDGAIHAEPAHADYYFALAALEQRAENWKGLIEAGERLLKLDPSNYAEAYMLAANGYYKSGGFDLAEERAKAGLRIDGGVRFPKLHELLAWVQVERGNAATGQQRRKFYEAAADEFRQYLKNAPATGHSAEVQAALNDIAGQLASGAAAQEAPAVQPSPEAQPSLTLRSQVTLVQVDVIARDGKGRAVEDLRQAEFELTDNGKPRPIATFAMERRPAAPPAPPKPAAPNVFSNEVADPSAPRAVYTVILMDWFNSGIDNTQWARLDALKVLKQLEPNARVALYSLDRNGLRIVNEFGATRDEIVKSIGSLTGLASPCRAMKLSYAPDTICDDPMIGDPRYPGLLHMLYTFMEERVNNTLAAFRDIAGHLSGVPGRKNLVWISAGIPSYTPDAPDGAATGAFTDAQAPVSAHSKDFDRAFRELNGAGVSVYPVDSRGLTFRAPYDYNGIPHTAMLQLTAPIMDEIASRTGGVAYHGRNDLDFGIRQAIDDASVAYWLGFYAPWDETRPGFHRLAIQVHREGVKLHYREGYTLDAGVVAPEDRGAQISRTSLSPVDATAVPMQVTAARTRNALTLRIAVKPEGLGLTHTEGRWRGSLDVATQFGAGKEDPNATVQFEPIDLDLTEAAYAAAAHDGLMFPKTLDIPAGADRVKVFLRSGASGGVGSLTIKLKEVEEK